MSFEIAKLEDTGFAHIKRLSAWVIPKDILSIDGEKLKKISEEIVDVIKSKHKFNALIIFYIRDDREIGFGYSLGRSIYAPYGKISEAKNNCLGDYTNFILKHNLKPLIKKEFPKDLKDYPNKEELEIYYKWLEIRKTDIYHNINALDILKEETGKNLEEIEDIIYRAQI